MPMGFSHNLQSRRVVEYIENEGAGLFRYCGRGAVYPLEHKRAQLVVRQLHLAVHLHRFAAVLRKGAHQRGNAG